MPYKDIRKKREKERQWYLSNKEKKNKKSRDYISKNRVRVNIVQKERRHRLGINKKYNTFNGISRTIEYRRIHRKKYKYSFRNAGELKLETIQLVYEDNIKKYGKMTCYLCLNPIILGEDELEHKIPLSRGGTNMYNNLEISCRKCNRKKRDKNHDEFMKMGVLR